MTLLDIAVDERVLDMLDKKYAPPSAFLEFARTFAPTETPLLFGAASRCLTVEVLLHVVAADSKLAGPFRAHFESTDDARLIENVLYLADGEHATSWGLFGKLLPFAALRAGRSLSRSTEDLLCIDCRADGSRPVVLWRANAAQDAWFAWDVLPAEMRFSEADEPMNVAWDSFLEPIADSFEAFLATQQRD